MAAIWASVSGGGNHSPVAGGERRYVMRATAMVALRDNPRGPVLLSAPSSDSHESRQPRAEQEQRGGLGDGVGDDKVA
jgi:hypothetical protein